MDTYKQKVIRHLGIVAGICNEIELIKTIDAEIRKPKRKVTVGQACNQSSSMRWGGSGRAMYLHPDYYRKRPVEWTGRDNDREAVFPPRRRLETFVITCDVLTKITAFPYDVTTSFSRVIDIVRRVR